MLQQMVKRRQSTVEGAEGSIELSDEGSRTDDDFMLEKLEDKDKDQGLLSELVDWVFADRDIAREQTHLEAPDVLRLRTRCDASAVFAAGSVVVNFFGGIWFLCFGILGGGVLLTCNALLVLASLYALRRISARSGAIIVDVVNLFAALLISVTLAVPFTLYGVLEHGPHTSDVAIWTLMAPVAAIFLIPNRVLEMSTAIHCARTLAVTLLLSWDALPRSEEEMEAAATEVGWRRRVCSVGVLMATHFVCPVCIALALRMAMAEFHWWRESLAALSDQQHDRAKQNRELINSVVPRGKEGLVKIGSEQPRLSTTSMTSDGQHTTTQVTMELDRKVECYSDCSVLQMDIKGFTTLSSKMSAEDLVDLINTIFTSIDEAADVIGNVWKVETIGDCYKAVVGGIFPCDDHVQRAVCLATLILEIVQGISRRLVLQPSLTVRCGVHTGPVTAAMVGTLLPRYLIYGRTCDMVSQLEASADTNHVHCSAETSARLPERWRRREREMELARGGGTVSTFALALQEDARHEMLSEKQRELLRGVLAIFQKPLRSDPRP